MRITNKIMQNNNLSNINTNKLLQDRLSTQMSTEKKINRPSDDPVVAIRSLRLRSNVTEITQYYSKNIPDAESWLKVTEESLKTLSDIVTAMRTQCVNGAKDYLTSSDRQTIIEQLKALADEVYTTGDADYAGRYVFTGYRTDTSLSFPETTEKQYRITEQLDKNAIDQVTVITTHSADGSTDVMDMTTNNYQSITVEKEDVQAVQAYRFRLAYGSCDGTEDPAPKIEYQGRLADGTLDTLNNPQSIEAEIVHDYESPYEQIANAAEDEVKVIFVPETGEMLLSKGAYDKLMATKDDASTTGVNEGEIRITYDKSKWTKGDLRPEHYFYCEADPGTDEEVIHNPTYLTGNVERQDIEYDVGFNQTIRINSTADECFKHGIGREVQDLVNAMQDVVDTEKIVTDLKDLLKTASGADAEEIQKKLDVAQKALELKSNKAQKMFEHGITSMQGHLDDTNLSITNAGTRSRKLELIENRVQSQKTTFETLKSENEDIDIAEVIINLTSAKLTYEAALMATGKVAQTSLLQYI
ncbi:MAG: flagellar hook-associated protein FlgL [Acetatifactor sp.]|nr:flagellar hook-associated protein FlgL [Acetatifactor sp.]